MRNVLLALALSADVRRSQLDEIVDPAAVDAALETGLLLLDGDRVRPSHPLLAAAAKRRSGAAERRRLHLELAGVVVDEELRARHLALATELPDAELATTVAAAAAVAAARGARQEAAELADHALRLTPPGSPEHTDRLLTLASYLDLAGELQRLTDLLEPALDTLPPGGARVRALLLLAEGGGVRSLDDIDRHLDSALAECYGDPVLRAHVLAKKSDHGAVSAVSRIPEAEEWAVEALQAAPLAGPDVERLALLALGWARALRGRAIDDLCERFRDASAGASSLADSPERVAAQRLVWRGDVEEARAVLTRLQALADEQGELIAYALHRLHLCELELRVGNWNAAANLLDEWAASSEGELLIWPMYERCRALLAAGRGLHEEAERWAVAVLERAEASGGGWDPLEALRARGTGALLAHEPRRAVASLRTVWEHTEREGVEEPGVFPVAPELVEALAELGELGEARSVSARLRELAEQQKHPWGLATARRCAAVVELSSGYEERAVSSLDAVADAYDRLGLRFDRARSLRVLGRALRRHRKWAGARDTLEQAASAFRRARILRVGRGGSIRALARRCAAAATERRADACGAARRGAGRGGAREQGDRACPLRQRQDGRSPPVTRVREARRSLAGAARSQARVGRSVVPAQRVGVSPISAERRSAYGRCMGGMRGVLLVLVAVAATAVALTSPGRPLAQDICPQPDFRGDYPKDEELPWSENVQGVAHDDGHWFFTQQDALLKLPADFALHRDPDFERSPRGELRRTLGSYRALAGFDHFGDIDQFGGFVFAPLQKPPRQARGAIAAFNTSDLELLDLVDVTAVMGASVGWLAIDQWRGYLYTSPPHVSDNPATYLYRFAIDLAALRDPAQPGDWLAFKDRVMLMEADGTPLRQALRHMQGGVFTPWGDLVLENGFIDDPPRVDRGGIHERGTDPLDADTDGDHIPDGEEVDLVGVDPNPARPELG